jgi:cytochrome bd-type quinol oxidase subunit 2
MSAFFFARSLMALSLAFHIVFAALGIGMPLLMAIAEGMHLRTRQPVYLELSKRWSLAAIGQVTLILVGWCLAQYPNLVTPDVTVNNAHAPEVTLRLLVLALGAGAIILLPSLGFLFHIFKGKEGR